MKLHLKKRGDGRTQKILAENEASELTVGSLRKALKNIPDDVLICAGGEFTQYSINTVTYNKSHNLVKLITEGVFDYKKVRKVQYDEKGKQIMTYMVPNGEKNPCGCGSNCFHYEYDGNDIYCVCNACNADLFIFNKDAVANCLKTGLWFVRDFK